MHSIDFNFLKLKNRILNFSFKVWKIIYSLFKDRKDQKIVNSKLFLKDIVETTNLIRVILKDIMETTKWIQIISKFVNYRVLKIKIR